MCDHTFQFRLHLTSREHSSIMPRQRHLRMMTILRRFILALIIALALLPLFLTSRLVSHQISNSIQSPDSILIKMGSPLSKEAVRLQRPASLLVDLHSEDPPTKMTPERKQALSPTSSLEWKNGCIQPPNNNTITTQNIIQSRSSIGGPPKGLVVVLAMAPGDMVTRIETMRRTCSAVKSQFRYFLSSQQLDMLFIIQEDEANGWTAKTFTDCWDLKFSGKPKRTWRNLDGTSMTTLEYEVATATTHNSRKTKVYVAKTTVELPKYIRENPTILQEPIVPKACEAPREYIQATRFYTRELLHLGILKDYEYFLKVDTDIVFRESIPFFILQDMKQKGAVFGHTAQYHRGSKTCANGIRDAVANFTATFSTRNNNKSKNLVLDNAWKGTLCTNSEEVNRDADQYYTNFIIGSVEFWQSSWVLDFSNFLNEWREGFFRYRWTDQIFWHFAMALFLDHFQDHVVDYTDLRCMPNKDCWQSSYQFQIYGADAWHQCPNNGYFLHPKDFRIPKKLERDPTLLTWNSTQELFVSTYGADCSKAK